MIIHGDSIEKLRTLDAESISALVTDPPYGMGNTSPARVAECLAAWSTGETWTPSGKGFMGKSWDSWVPPPELWREVFRVLKPGGYGLVFASSRTQDLMSISLRLAGFEVRDTIQWLYGSGFPKSHNVALSIDKKLGYESRVVGSQKMTGTARKIKGTNRHGGKMAGIDQEYEETTIEITAPSSEPGKRYEGWGTALKPAYEPIILIRKPLSGTVAQNVLEYGTGGLNIDACRFGHPPKERGLVKAHQGFDGGAFQIKQRFSSPHDKGRWPANVILDHEAGQLLGEAQRFFYCPKASKREREAGLEYRNPQLLGHYRMKSATRKERTTKRANIHPTVKPLDLMRYLVRLITPPQGTVLDPFAGSGTTLCAAALEGFPYIGIEREDEYIEIIKARVKHWTPTPDEQKSNKPEPDEYGQLSLF